MNIKHLVTPIVLIIALSSCKVYQQNVLFKTENSVNEAAFYREVALAEQNYRIEPYDIIKLEVFTNYGEMLIDPNMELLREGGGGGMMRNMFSREFRVDSEGTAFLPMIGPTELKGKTLYQADSFLMNKYNDIYRDAFVRLQLINKRVVVLGAIGGQVIPLPNDGISLIEVLAMAGGLDNTAKGHNIRIIRGDLSDPQVQLIDLTTIDGLRKANLNIEAGDIIYVEPLRRVFVEGLRDAAPLIGVVTNIVTLAVIIQNFRPREE